MARHTERQAELDGVRAIAVLAVVLYHARVPWFGGGFVGVDVFFVLSGFLITRLLLREHARSGRISLAHFWARRVRRIVPTLLITVVLTVAVGRWVEPPWEWRATLGSARAAVGSISNFYFWLQPGGYFAAPVEQQPLLHTWSLGVEEQFYVVWPVAVLLALRIGGRRAMALWVAAAALSSFAISMVLSARSPSAAFYLPHTRVWELAVGAGVATAGAAVARVPARVRSIGGWVGILAILHSAWAGAVGSFPAPGALFPVLATALVITAVDHPAPGALGRLLSWRLFNLVGRWSYSWYLFHWPAITFVRVVRGGHHMWMELAASALALLLAAANWHLVERRLAAPPGPRRWGPRATVVVGVGASVAVLAGATVLAHRHTVAPPTALDGVELISSADGGTIAPPTTASPADPGFDWHSSEGLQILDASRQNVVWPCIDFTFNDVFDPACAALPGERSIVVIGDSHASGAALAAAPIAREEGLGLIVVGQPQCPVAGVEIWLDAKLYGGCGEWAARVVDDIVAEASQVAAVVWTARSDSYFPGASIAQSLNLGEPDIGTLQALVSDTDAAAALWRDGLRAMAQRLADAGIPLVLLHSSPELHQWPSDCILASDADQCAAARAELDPYRAASVAAETAALDGIDVAAIVDPYDVLCDAQWCPVVSGNVVLYRDDNHVSPQGAALWTPLIRAAMEKLGVVRPDELTR